MAFTATTFDVRFAFIQSVTEMGTVTTEEAEAAFDEWLENIEDVSREAGFDSGLQSAEMCS